MRMGVSLAARKHPVLTTPRDTKAQVTPVGEVASYSCVVPEVFKTFLMLGKGVAIEYNKVQQFRREELLNFKK